MRSTRFRGVPAVRAAGWGGALAAAVLPGAALGQAMRGGSGEGSQPRPAGPVQRELQPAGERVLADMPRGGPGRSVRPLARPPIPLPPPIDGDPRPDPVPTSGEGTPRGPGCTGVLSSMLAPAASFEALPDTNSGIPPDSMGAVGPAHVVTHINYRVNVQSRTGTGGVTVNLGTFWSAVSGNAFDPRVVYDALTDRWIAVAGTDPQNVNSAVGLAVSTTGNPGGSWRFFRLDADAGNAFWADFPCVGFNDSWIVVTANMYGVGTNAWGGSKMWVVNKASALGTGTMTLAEFPRGFDMAPNGGVGNSLQPSQCVEPGGGLFLVENSGWSSGGTIYLRLSRITGTAGAPAWSVVPNSPFPGYGLFPIPAPQQFNYTQIEASQLGDPRRIATGDPRISGSVPLRGGMLYCAHSGGLPATGTPNRTAAFWHQLNPASAAPFVQSGRYEEGPDTHFTYPSIAANCAGDVCIGFTRSDPTRYATAAYAMHLAGSPAGSTGFLQTLRAGLSTYYKTFGGASNRWGDYSATVVDPADDRSFWTIQEYAAMRVGPGDNDSRWGTWWGKIEAPSACYANCDGSTQTPVLNVADFGCFLTRYAAGEAYANCDGSTQAPVLNVADFGCFLTRYAAGCP
ncbi:MAG: hypothetical protein WD749_00790 [Phycisphaerales bacterium]